jgi:hypothetical protein
MKHFAINLGKLIGKKELAKVLKMNYEDRKNWFNNNKNKLREQIFKLDEQISDIIYDEILIAESSYYMIYRGKFIEK